MGAVRVNGSTSGYVELAAPAVAGSVVMTLPATTGTLAVQGEAYGRSATATVMTRQTTTSASYVDLATVGPQVTLTTGTKAFVTFACPTGNTPAACTNRIAVAVSGATTVAASNDYSANCDLVTNNADSMVSKSFIFTGLTPGSNIFTLKYFTTSGTAAFFNRFLTVIDLGS